MKLNRRIDYFAASSFALFALLVFAAVSPVVKTNTFADEPILGDTELAISTSALEMVASNIATEGTFVESSPANIEVSTTNYTGYKLTIAASDPTSLDAGKLINGAYAIEPISTPAIADDFENNTWGLLPSMVNSTANSVYQPAPTDAEIIINETTAANRTADNYTLAFGAKVNYNIPAGRYSNTFVIAATPNPVMYGIVFAPSVDTGITNIPEAQYGTVLTNEVVISDQIPERSGYDFVSWCAGEVTTSAGIDTCDADSYFPGSTIDMLTLASPFVEFKTMWTPTTYTISYDLDEGTALDNPTEYTIVMEDITLNRPTRDGYKFMGWTGTDLTEPTKDVVIPAGSIGNRSYVATWVLRTCEFTSETFAYTGGVQSWTVPAGCDGTYQLEVWGGAGGSAKGGYSVGNKELVVGDELDIVVGGAGTAGGNAGYNGGGTGGGENSNYATGGGGATHIALHNDTYTTLKSYANATTAAEYVLLVAGGGGGSVGTWNYGGTSTRIGGAGGGESGLSGSTWHDEGDSGTAGYGATQTAAGCGGRCGSFGQGGVGSGAYHGFGGGGGGGWYGGGGGVAGVRWSCSGGGGSGWIGGVEDGTMESGIQSNAGQATITYLDAE